MNNIINLLKNTTPKYTITQPSTDKVISYRPFNVREEKALLVSKGTGTYSDFLITIRDIINNCFELPVDSKNLPIFDIEYLFLKLREKSVSEVVNISFTCPHTSEKIKNMEIYLNEVEVVKQPHIKNIKITNDIIVNMRYPSLEFLIENTLKTNIESVDLFDMVLYSIESIETPDEIITHENFTPEFLNSFIDNLTKQQYQLILDFFTKIPKIEHIVNYRTSDGVDRKIVLRGIRDFFR